MKVVSWAITLTLALRVVGALLFGRLADRYGRKPLLMVNILLFSVLECASGFAPNLTAFLVLRALFGIAMGGEWGIGASLTMESIPTHWRGFVSGLLQSGYSFGYLLAALAFGAGFSTLGWRGLFIVAIFPALLVLYIRSKVSESPGWNALRTKAVDPSTPRPARGRHITRYLYAIALMAAARPSAMAPRTCTRPSCGFSTASRYTKYLLSRSSTTSVRYWVVFAGGPCRNGWVAAANWRSRPCWLSRSCRSGPASPAW